MTIPHFSTKLKKRAIAQSYFVIVAMYTTSSEDIKFAKTTWNNSLIRIK